MGGVDDLDLFKDHVVDKVFSSKNPKLFAFFTGDYKRIEKILLPAVRPYMYADAEQQFVPFAATPERGGGAWEAFGLSEKTGPHIGIHDTVNEAKYIMKGKLTPKRLEKFLSDFWDGKLSAARQNGGQDDAQHSAASAGP